MDFQAARAIHILGSLWGDRMCTKSPDDHRHVVAPVIGHGAAFHVRKLGDHVEAGVSSYRLAPSPVGDVHDQPVVAPQQRMTQTRRSRLTLVVRPGESRVWLRVRGIDADRGRPCPVTRRGIASAASRRRRLGQPGSDCPQSPLRSYVVFQRDATK